MHGFLSIVLKICRKLFGQGKIRPRSKKDIIKSNVFFPAHFSSRNILKNSLTNNFAKQFQKSGRSGQVLYDACASVPSLLRNHHTAHYSGKGAFIIWDVLLRPTPLLIPLKRYVFFIKWSSLRQKTIQNVAQCRQWVDNKLLPSRLCLWYVIKRSISH